MKFVLIIIWFYFQEVSLAENLDTLIKGIEKQKEILNNREQAIKGKKGKSPIEDKGVSKPKVGEVEKEVLIIESVSEKVEAQRKLKRSKSRKKYCKKYTGKLISYYGEVFFIKGCKRIQLSLKQLTSQTRKGVEVHEVTGDVINSIPKSDGETYQRSKPRGCRELANSYITIDNDEIFFLQACKKRIFPDWATFNRHRSDHKTSKIYEITWDELNSFDLGEPFISILDNTEFKLGETVDTIPVGEACRGLEGKFVTYYSRVYKIFKCHKRPVDPVIFSRKVYDKPKELTSEQWLSLPTGEDLTL